MNLFAVLSLFTDQISKTPTLSYTKSLTSRVMLARNALSCFIMAFRGMTKAVTRNTWTIVSTSGITLSTKLKTESKHQNYLFSNFWQPIPVCWMISVHQCLQVLNFFLSTVVFLFLFVFFLTVCYADVVVQFYPWYKKFYFPLLQNHYHTLPYPKTKQQKK